MLFFCITLVRVSTENIVHFPHNGLSCFPHGDPLTARVFNKKS